MNRFLLDSNAINAFVNHHLPFMDRVREAQARGDPIGTCEPVIAELYYGLEFSATKEANLVRLERGFRRIKSWPFSRDAAREYGRIAAELKRRARHMQIIDMMVAAVACSLPNCIVVTTDSDFSAIPGLATINWMTP